MREYFLYGKQKVKHCQRRDYKEGEATFDFCRKIEFNIFTNK